MNRWKKSRDNRGMSLVMVIGTVALVSILVVIVLSLSLMNIQMKSVYKKSADNFYDAEAAMDEIRTGLQQDVADAATKAYLSVMSQYSASSYQDAVRQSTFRELYRKELKKKSGRPWMIPIMISAILRIISVRPTVMKQQPVPEPDLQHRMAKMQILW